jgi:hypothetical protein
MFSLERQQVKLADVNPRAERHGEEHVIAADLKLEANMDNGCLAFFHPTLKSLLYFKDESVVNDLVDQIHEAPNLRYKALGLPLKWTTEIIGASVSVHTPVSGKDIELDMCGVNNFQLEPMEGGTVKLTFRVQAHPSERDLGKLCSMIQQDVEVSVTPPGENA